MKKKIEIIGVMIDEKPNYYRYYRREELYEGGRYAGNELGYKAFGRGLSDYLRSISDVTSAATQFVIVYDNACLYRDEHINKLLTEISAVKKNDCLPTLISINDELKRSFPWQPDVSKNIITSAMRQQVFMNIIDDQFCNAEKELLAAQSLVNSNVGVFAADTNQNSQITSELTSKFVTS